MARRKGVVKRMDVAELAGVSPTTVSLVLNNHPGIRISDATRERVRKAADKLGYYPSGLARALVTGKINAVGVVLYHQQTPFDAYSALMLRGFWQKIRERRMRMIVDAPQEHWGAAGFFKEKIVDGAIFIAPTPEPDEEVSAMIETDFPFVLAGSKFHSVTADYVDIDNVHAQRRMTEMVLKAGHENILYLAGPPTMTSGEDRRLGFEEAMKAAGRKVDPKRVLEGNYLEDKGEENTAKALDGGLRFTAIIAANDGMARGAVKALASRGIRIPQQVSIVGINGYDEEYRAGLCITTLRQPLERIGEEAGSILLQRLDGKKGKPKEVLLQGTLIQGETLAPPPGA